MKTYAKLSEELGESHYKDTWGAIGSDQEYKPTRKYGSPSVFSIDKIKKKKEAEKKQTGLYKKQTPSSRANYVKNQLAALKHIHEEDVDEGFKAKVAGIVGGVVGLGAGAYHLDKQTPHANINGEKISIAPKNVGHTPPNAKIMTDKDGKKYHVYHHRTSVNRPGHTFATPVDEGFVAEGKDPTTDAAQEAYGFQRGVVKKNKDGSHVATSYSGSRKIFKSEMDAKAHANSGKEDAVDEGFERSSAEHLKKHKDEMEKNKQDQKAKRERMDMNLKNYQAGKVRASDIKEDVDEGFERSSAEHYKQHKADMEKHKQDQKTAAEIAAKKLKDYQSGNVRASDIKEDAEQVQEVLNPSMGAGEYVKDFQKSDAPQFKGKSKEKRRMMGIAAYLQAKRDVKEEVEQMDELNSSDIVKIHNDAAAHHTASLANKPEQKPKSMLDKIKDKWSKADPKKYQKYYAKEEVEQMDEAPLRAVSALVGYPKLNKKIASKGTPGSEDERNKAAAGLKRDRSGLGRAAYTGTQHYDVRREEIEMEEGYFSDQDVQRQDKRIASAKAKKAMTPPFSGPYTKSPATTKDKSGAVHTPMSRAKHLARVAMQQKMKEEFGVDIDDVMADSLVETVLDEGIWTEALIGGQKKLDKNRNGKLDAEDFKKLRKEAKDEEEYGYEGDMAVNQLNTIMRHSKYLIDMMEPDTDLPEWVQSKITLACDYIQTSCDYMTSEMKEEISSYGKKAGVSEDINFDDEGTLVTEKVSYSDFLRNLQEIKLADLPKRTVTGRAYGSQKDEPEDDEDEDEDKPKAVAPAVKRGRGRPVGSKSGAAGKVQQSDGKKKSGIEYTGFKLHLPNSNKSY